jgi:hypothetical protein
VRIKVFACAVHGECQLDDTLSRVHACRTCEERSLDK